MPVYAESQDAVKDNIILQGGNPVSGDEAARAELERGFRKPVTG